MTERRFPPDEDGEQTGRAAAGRPGAEHDPLTPMGEIEQVGRLISGLSRQTGWRSAAARLVAAAVLLALVAAIVLGALRAAHVLG
jgi:hypothetical protein